MNVKPSVSNSLHVSNSLNASNPLNASEQFHWLCERLHQASATQRQVFARVLGARLFSEANDIKRTRAALAKELGWQEDTLAQVFAGQASVEQALQLLAQFIQHYPLSLSDLWLDLPLPQGCVLMTPVQSQATARVFSRPNAQGEHTPYYEYRDTAMAPQAPFRPEWILELRQVADAHPENPDVIYNKGHLMNQFTFFIGEVNFYWEDQGKKYACEMHTGDSCHITPFAPHTFASRNPDQPGLIIAVTYGDHLRRANNHLALDAQAASSYLAPLLATTAPEHQAHSPFNLALRLHLDADLQTPEQLAQAADMPLVRLQALLSHAKPSTEEVVCLAKALLLRPEDLFQSIEAQAVERATFVSTPWIEDSRTGTRHKALARSPSQPGMKSFVLEVPAGVQTAFAQHAYHQYVYNFGQQTLTLVLGDQQTQCLEPGASCYLQPFAVHAFCLEADAPVSAVAQLLIVRLAAHFNQPTINELAQINPAGRQRLLNETSQWF